MFLDVCTKYDKSFNKNIKTKNIKYINLYDNRKIKSEKKYAKGQLPHLSRQ